MPNSVSYKKKILMICPFSHPNIGGVETHLDKLVDYLGKNGYYTTLLTYQPLSSHVKGIHHEKREHYEIHRVQWFGVGLFDRLETKFALVFLYVFPGLFIKSIYYYLQHYKEIDCIHAHGMVAAVIAVCCKALHKKRLVISTHAIYNFEGRTLLLKLFVKNILRFFDKIIAVSEVSKKELVGLGLNSNKITCFKNWVDTDVFRPINALNGPKSSKVSFLFLSRFIEKKGILAYLKAAETINNADFYIIGGGQLEPEVKAAAQSNANIKYLGVLNQTIKSDLEKMVQTYNLADYFVSPYLYDEGYSATLLEAVSCGLQVVIPDRGSPPGFLDRSVMLLMPSEINDDILVQTLRSLADKPKTPQSIATCREFAENHLGFINAKIISDAYAD
jgi:glycosyltransferase involved in cell wall biosynthesis